VFDFLTRTIESPCRKCENVDMNKEECSDDCSRLREFQDAILFYEEFNIKEFGLRTSYS
jgi:hypothetical protein